MTLAAECTIIPAPPDSLAAGASTSVTRRKACKDVTSCELVVHSSMRTGTDADAECGPRCTCLAGLASPRLLLAEPRSVLWGVLQLACTCVLVLAALPAASNLRRIVGHKKALSSSGSVDAGLKDAYAERHAGACRAHAAASCS